MAQVVIVSSFTLIISLMLGTFWVVVKVSTPCFLLLFQFQGQMEANVHASV